MTREQSEVLEYLAALQGRELHHVLRDAVEEYLERNYTFIAEEHEQKLGLPTTVIHTRGRFNDKKAWKVMQSNLDRLCGVPS